MVFFLIIALIIALLLEGTVTTVPLVLVFLLCLLIIKRETIVFFIAFLAGLLLDILSVRTPGISSLFFITFLFMILLYQRKYEINSYPFVFFASVLGSFGFLAVVGYGNWLWGSVLSSFFALCLYATVRFFTKEVKPHGFKSV